MALFLAELYEDGGVVGGAELGSRGSVDLAAIKTGGQVGREKEVIDADAAVVLEGLAEVVPKGELSGFVRVEGAEGVGVAEGEEGAVGGAGFGLEEGVAQPRGGLMAVDVFGDDVEVAADDSGGGGGEPCGHLELQAGHPGEFVGELFGADGIAVGQIDVDDADAVYDGLEEASVAVLLVAGEGGGDGFQGRAGEDGDAVVRLLGDGGGGVAKTFKVLGGEVCALELLEEEDIGLVGLEPVGDVVEAGADGVDVPGGDADGRAFPFEVSRYIALVQCAREKQVLME